MDPALFRLTVLLFVSLGCVLSCTDQDDSFEWPPAEALDLAQQYGAETWRSRLDSMVFRYPFSMEVRQAMMPADSAPTLFIGSLEDVDRLDELNMLLTFKEDDLDFEIVLRVACAQQSLARRVREKLWSNDFFWDYAVIVNVEEVNRAALSLTTESEDGAAWVDSDLIPDVFIVTGKCIGVVPLE